MAILYDGYNRDEIVIILFAAFMILGVTTIVMIYKALTLYYRKKLLENELKQYKTEIEKKDKELEKIKNEKYNISKITHKFYNRQKALEYEVATGTYENDEMLNRIKNLTDEYSQEIKKINNLPELDKTEIPEIDQIFKYMQEECVRNNIEFKLRITENIYPLINNVISKNQLETLIGDHIRDAINAISDTKTDNKEILVILGIREEKYELCILDTGIEFEINTLLKLGLENITTHEKDGGSGMGFMTTFDTLRETKASLIITEEKPTETMYFTKSVTIRFDNENIYKIQSYRANKIIKLDSSKRFKIINSNLTAKI